MSSELHVGMLGPATIRDFREYLYPSEWREDLPAGMGGTPVNLLCREFLRRGHRVTLFTADAALNSVVTVAGPHLRICIVPYGKPPGRGPARDFFRAERREIVAAIRRERPNVLHAHWTYYYAMAAQASGVPYVITAHDAPMRVLTLEFIPYRIAHTLMAYSVIPRARHIVSVSPYIASHLRRWMLYRGPATVIPNGLPDSVFRLGEGRHRRDGATFASVLTGFSTLKNGKAAIEAFASVRAEWPGARLILMGYGHEPGGLAEQWARRRSLEHGIEFVGQVPHGDVLARLATDVDVYIHPSLEESFSMALAEASAVGVASIGGESSGGVPHTLDYGRAGILLDVRDSSALADAMKRLIRDSGLRESMAASARAYALRNFHIAAVADAYLDVYASLLRER